MKFNIDNDGQLVVTADLRSNKKSRSGNTTILATSHGNQIVGKIGDRTVYAQVNIFTLNEEELGREEVGKLLEIIPRSDRKAA